MPKLTAEERMVDRYEMFYLEKDLARMTLAELNYVVSAVNQYAEQGYSDWPAAVRLAFAHNRKLLSGQKYRARKQNPIPAEMTKFSQQNNKAVHANGR